jgi:hypothetical protein
MKSTLYDSQVSHLSKDAEYSHLQSFYEGVSKRFRTESITKYTLTTINTRWEATQRVMEAKFTTVIRKIAIQLRLVAESCTKCSFRSRRPVRKLLDTPSYKSTLVQLVTWVEITFHSVVQNFKMGIMIQLIYPSLFLMLPSDGWHNPPFMEP